MADDSTRHKFGEYMARAELFIYSVLGVLLALTALAVIAVAGKELWDGVSRWTIEAKTLNVLNDLLIVLMMVELLHTVRISIRWHYLVTEPFLVVGLIATIRRILVVTLETSALSREGHWLAEGASIFRASLYELALLGFLVVVLVVSIALLRRYAPSPKEVLDS